MAKSCAALINTGTHTHTDDVVKYTGVDSAWEGGGTVRRNADNTKQTFTTAIPPQTKYACNRLVHKKYTAINNRSRALLFAIK